jgi:hypothetical protein
MKKYIQSMAFIVISAFGIQAAVAVESNTVPEPFQGFDDNSGLTIRYSDLDSLLDAVVLNTGRSNREKADLPKASTGTRMKFSVNRATVNEGNRFYYEIFANSQENQQTLASIQNRLERIPSFNSLAKFSRDEQLAYWINLYNVTILDEIVKIYPERRLDDFLVGKKSILSKKILDVAGVPLSLNDIQFTILMGNYDNNPLIMYGLYQGNIGGPNIRKSAYTGKYIYADLIDNALEFINSNRGTESKNAKTFRVSSLYERNEAYFDNFQADLKVHLLNYLEGDVKAELQSSEKIKANIDDWTVTDLFGSTRDLTASFGSNNAALVGALGGGESSRLASKTSAATRYSPAVIDHLNELNRKRESEKTGTVTVEEIGQIEDESQN